MHGSLTVYDGANGIGGNKLYLEENGRGFFLDFGKNFGEYPALDGRAVLLSHAHMDHCGNIGTLRKNIQIVASPESIINKMPQ